MGSFLVIESGVMKIECNQFVQIQKMELPELPFVHVKDLGNSQRQLMNAMNLEPGMYHPADPTNQIVRKILK